MRTYFSEPRFSVKLLPLQSIFHGLVLEQLFFFLLNIVVAYCLWSKLEWTFLEAYRSCFKKLVGQSSSRILPWTTLLYSSCHELGGRIRSLSLEVFQCNLLKVKQLNKKICSSIFFLVEAQKLILGKKNALSCVCFCNFILKVVL